MIVPATIGPKSTMLTRQVPEATTACATRVFDEARRASSSTMSPMISRAVTTPHGPGPFRVEAADQAVCSRDGDLSGDSASFELGEHAMQTSAVRRPEASLVSMALHYQAHRLVGIGAIADDPGQVRAQGTHSDRNAPLGRSCSNVQTPAAVLETPTSPGRRARLTCCGEFTDDQTSQPVSGLDRPDASPKALCPAANSAACARAARTLIGPRACFSVDCHGGVGCVENVDSNHHIHGLPCVRGQGLTAVGTLGCVAATPLRSRITVR